MHSSMIFFLVIFYSFITIDVDTAAPNSPNDHSISTESQDQYEPLYVTKTRNGEYKFVDSVTYDMVMNKREFNTSEQKMFAACPTEDITDKRLEITNANEKQLADGFKCTRPIQFEASKNENSTDHRNIIFSISEKSSDNSLNASLPDTTLARPGFPLTLISVAYRKGIGRHITTWHNIKYSNMIGSDEEPYGKENENQNDDEHAYDKDTNIYKFDIDPLYKMENQSYYTKEFLGHKFNSKLVKLQLAPAADFYFDAWKRASRSNINTTPVWQEFTAEWYQLEKFIRRVANIVGDLRVITGGDSPLMYLGNETLSNLLPVFSYIFKAVYFNQRRKDGQWIRQGILFVMMNDPRVEMNKKCEFTEKNGWRYLEDENLKPRIIASPMNPDTLAELQVDIVHTYADFNLNQLKKLSTVGDEEVEDEIDVVKLLQIKTTKEVEKVFDPLGTS